jgi:phosphoenolpyruvate carboxykinase (GTP)
MVETREAVEDVLGGQDLARLAALENERLIAFVKDAVELCRPAKVTVCGDSKEDADYLREGAMRMAEETPLETEGHTVHFDGPADLARDPASTKYLLPRGVVLGERIRSVAKGTGLAEIRDFLHGAMEGREMLVCFFCLGPIGSDFSISCVQITDSFYVAHSESILYRAGYEQFKRGGGRREFFRFLHSAGALDERGASRDTNKRRIFIDLEDDAVYSVNTQYAGNTVGLKKLALRLAIRKAVREGWLAEHMFLMGVGGPKGRVSFFTGAFPSASGKTSTAMIPGQTIVGDDLTYLRVRSGEAFAANVEAGVFGIIEDVNARDDPAIWEALTCPGEVIFSNVLVKDGRPYWIGMGEEVEIPESGVNFQGEWHKGKKSAGADVSFAHKNARYTIRISQLKNRSPRADDPGGVPVRGVLFGGRDSDTGVPVEEAFDWAHGVITKGASLESETTAAIIGRQGVRRWDPMSTIDFMSVSVGEYIGNYLGFGAALRRPPSVFSVNYFLKGSDGAFLNSRLDKKVWLLWAELRANGDVAAIDTPTGRIPLYADLRRLFRDQLRREYAESDYVEQFTVRIPEHIARLERMDGIFRAEPGIPQIVWDQFRAQRERLEETRRRFGKDRVSPLELGASPPR